jgi:1,4-dihydroxy-2-naphthoate octaprenyltransferase
MIASYKRNANISAVVWIAALVGLTALSLHNIGKDPLDSPLGPVLLVVCMGALIVSLWCYLKAKGRSSAWLFMLTFQVVGLLVILLLKDRAKDGQPPAPPAPQEYFG